MRVSIVTVIDMTILKILRCLKMGPIFASLGKSHQTKTYYHCQWCEEGNGARAEAYDNGRGTNNGAVDKRPITHPAAQPLGS